MKGRMSLVSLPGGGDWLLDRLHYILQLEQSDKGKLAHLQEAEIHLRTGVLDRCTTSEKKRQTVFCTMN